MWEFAQWPLYWTDRDLLCTQATHMVKQKQVTIKRKHCWAAAPSAAVFLSLLVLTWPNIALFPVIRDELHTDGGARGNQPTMCATQDAGAGKSSPSSTCARIYSELSCTSPFADTPIHTPWRPQIGSTSFTAVPDMLWSSKQVMPQESLGRVRCIHTFTDYFSSKAGMGKLPKSKII